MRDTVQTSTGISTWRAFFIAVTIVACGGSLAVAACAWFTHFKWLWTGEYAGNSFPMGAFAVNAIWFAGWVCLAAAAVWAQFLAWERGQRNR